MVDYKEATVLSTTDEQITLMQWLQKLTKTFGNAVITDMSLSNDGDKSLTFTFTLADGSTKTATATAVTMTEDEKALIGELVKTVTASSDGVTFNKAVTIVGNVSYQGNGIHQGTESFLGETSFTKAPTCKTTATEANQLITKSYVDEANEKCYQALKTVTKGFTRTDPVYVRIGEDGEPEIHYTIGEKKSGATMFIGYNLENCTFYLHGGANLTSAFAMFQGCGAKRIIVDSFANCDSVAQSLCHLGSSVREGMTKEIKVLDPTLNYGKAGGMSYIFYNQVAITELPMLDFSKMTGVQYEPFAECRKVKVMPAYDFANVTNITNFTRNMLALERIEATGIKWSFDISSTAMAHDAILYLFENGLSTVSKDDNITLTLGSAKLALMSDEEKLIATEKGWYLA